jgi:hypothetical protein
MIEIALWTEKVDQTYTVQDCVLEFISKIFDEILFDETPESAATLNQRLNWQENVEYLFANSVKELTFDFRGKRYRVTRTEQRNFSIWPEPKKRKGV